MTILAIDTCEARCSAALVRDGKALARISEEAGRRHAERLLPIVNDLFVSANIDKRQLERIAVTTGPGNYTGLRVGMSVAKGLALGLSVPCVGVTSLKALAFQSQQEGVVHAVIAGRGGQVFFQSFDCRRASNTQYDITPINDATCADADAVSRTVDKLGGEVIGSGASLLHIALPAKPEAVDPVFLARLAMTAHPPFPPTEPTYLRSAEAAKAKILFPVEPAVSPTTS